MSKTKEEALRSLSDLIDIETDRLSRLIEMEKETGVPSPETSASCELMAKHLKTYLRYMEEK